MKNPNHTYFPSQQSLIQPHPLHPAPNLTKPINPHQNFIYSSQFPNLIHLTPLFIHKTITPIQSSNVDYNLPLNQIFPHLIKTLQKQFAEHFNLQNYHLMIVHPS
ncbi:IucA/IucC family protein, partial [Staphylococcus epidermidis]|uniref:IucA/IucC family protein n=1 Tax=Staphylococcus epidermidis TaxID=1282 RepID=UPI0028CB5F50